MATKPTQINFKCSPRMYDVVFQLAHAEGLTPAEWARAAVALVVRAKLNQQRETPSETIRRRYNEQRDAEMIADGWIRGPHGSWTKPTPPEWNARRLAAAERSDGAIVVRCSPCGVPLFDE